MSFKPTHNTGGTTKVTIVLADDPEKAGKPAQQTNPSSTLDSTADNASAEPVVGANLVDRTKDTSGANKTFGNGVVDMLRQEGILLTTGQMPRREARRPRRQKAVLKESTLLAASIQSTTLRRPG